MQTEFWPNVYFTNSVYSVAVPYWWSVLPPLNVFPKKVSFCYRVWSTFFNAKFFLAHNLLCSQQSKKKCNNVYRCFSSYLIVQPPSKQERSYLFFLSLPPPSGIFCSCIHFGLINSAKKLSMWISFSPPLHRKTSNPLLPLFIYATNLQWYSLYDISLSHLKLVLCVPQFHSACIIVSFVYLPLSRSLK